VVALFETREDQTAITDVQAKWDNARALIFREKPPPSLPEVVEALKLMRELNFSFMQLGTRRYHEMVCARWNEDSDVGTRTVTEASAKSETAVHDDCVLA
jgi:hypothetical protein